MQEQLIKMYSNYPHVEETKKHIEETSHTANSFSSLQGPSPGSITFPVTGEQYNGNQQNGTLKKDERISSLNTPTRDQIASENKFENEPEDTNMDLSSSNRILTPLSLNESEEAETQKLEAGKSNTARKDDANRVLVDTAAPFESVKEAVTKFGEIVDWKTQKEMIVEKRKNVELELKKVQEETPVYKEQYEIAAAVKGQVQKELDYTKKLMEELKLGLEKAGTQEAHAKQDSELADLRLEEMKQGIAHSVSVAAKTQLEVAKERHTSAVAELKLVRQELQSMKREFESLIHERDLAVRTAEDSVSTSKEIEKTVEDLTLELITVKELLESAHSAHLEAEEQGRVAVFAFGQDRINWEKELKQAEGELQQLNEQLLLKTKGNSEIDNKQGLLANQAGDITETGTTTEAALATTTRELEEVRSNIETANDEINCLRVAVSSLKSELEKEKTALTTMRQRENLACVSISSLEAELNRVNTEVELVLKREKDTRERMVDLPKALQHAAEEADQAKLVANLAREELRKAKEEAEQAKAGASTMETRLKAALKEIEAARASEKLASSAVKALEESEQASMESEDSPNGVTLPIEEYYRLSKKANEAEEIANKRVISAVEQIKVAKESESRSLVKLEEANKMIEVKKKARAALEKAEKAKEAKICAEQELRTWREEHEQQIKVESLVRSLSDTSNLDSVGGLESTSSEADVTIRSSTGPPKVNMPRSHTANELPGNKRSFFPRIAMFLARKKVQIQSLK